MVLNKLLAPILLVLIFVFAYLLRTPQAPQEVIAQRLFHQMSRWSTASSQDTNPIIKVLHANYGVGFMMALQTISGDEELGRMVGLDNIRKVFDEVELIQSKATIELAKACPHITPEGDLAKYGSEGVQ
jgi:hypothetical protein